MHLSRRHPPVPPVGHGFPILKPDAKGFEQKVSHTDGYRLSHILVKRGAKQ